MKYHCLAVILVYSNSFQWVRHISLLKLVSVDAPVDQLAEFIQTINKQIEPFFIKIRAGKSEDKGLKYYALVSQNPLLFPHCYLQTGMFPF